MDPPRQIMLTERALLLCDRDVAVAMAGGHRTPDERSARLRASEDRDGVGSGKSGPGASERRVDRGGPAGWSNGPCHLCDSRQAIDAGNARDELRTDRRDKTA